MFSSQRLDVLTDLRCQLAGLGPVGDAADDTLLGLSRSLEDARRVIDAAQNRIVTVLSARGTTEITDGLSTKRWLARDGQLSGQHSARIVRVAETLARDLPEVGDALDEGRIGFDHAAVLAGACNPRIAAEFAEFQGELIDMASGMVFEAWRTRVRTLAALLDQDGGYDPDADVMRNRLTLQPGPDGTVVSGCLVGDVGVTVGQVLDMVTDQVWRQHQADHEATGADVPPMATLRALALAEVCRRAIGEHAEGDLTTPAGQTPGPGPDAGPAPGGLNPAGPSFAGPTPAGPAPTGPSFAETGARASITAGPIFAGTGVRAAITLVMHADETDVLYDTHDIAHRRQALGALLCDSDIAPVVLNSLGVPLDVGRQHRWYTRAQRTALARRDGGCVFPGCDAPVQRCHAHHVDHWADGGHTATARGVMVCAHHHGVIHRNGWHLDITTDGWATIETPAGQRMWGQRHHHQRTGPLPPPAPPPTGQEKAA